MNIIDKIIKTLEEFCDRQRENVLDCIPNCNRSRPNNWREDLKEQADIYQGYIAALESLRRSRSVHSLPYQLLIMILEEMEECG